MIQVLVADDAPFIREIVRNVVEARGMAIVGEAVDGGEAVALALSLKPDVVLMDIVMPVKSGIDAAREILSKNASIKIVAFSTVDQEAMISRAIDAGCCSYLVKPFSADELVKVITHAIQR
jgi:two-component system chemotaxis response regulator CheY